MGRAVGTLVGAGVGAMFGAPQVGAAIGGAVGGERDDRKAAGRGLRAQQQATDAALNLQRYQFDTSRADRAPYLAAGTNALQQLLGRVQGGFNPGDLAADPGYQFRLQQGAQAVDRSAAAQGGLYSGATLKALQKYGQGLASTEFGNAFQRWQSGNNALAGIAGVGQTALAQNDQAGQHFAGSADRLMTGMADARMGAYMGGATRNQNAWNQGLSTWGNYLSRPPPTRQGGLAPMAPALSSWYPIDPYTAEGW